MPQSYRSHRIFGEGYEDLTEVPEVPGIVALPYRNHRSSERVQNIMYLYPRCCGHGRTGLPEVPGTGLNVVQELPKVPGTGMNALQNLQRFSVR